MSIGINSKYEKTSLLTEGQRLCTSVFISSLIYYHICCFGCIFPFPRAMDWLVVRLANIYHCLKLLREYLYFVKQVFIALLLFSYCLCQR